MVFLLFFILFPYAAALVACWALLRYPQLWRGSLAVLLAAGASARLVLWAFREDQGGPVNLGNALGIMGFCQLFTIAFLAILISRVIELRKHLAVSEQGDVLALPSRGTAESDVAEAA